MLRRKFFNFDITWRCVVLKLLAVDAYPRFIYIHHKSVVCALFFSRYFENVVQICVVVQIFVMCVNWTQCNFGISIRLDLSSSCFVAHSLKCFLNSFFLFLLKLLCVLPISGKELPFVIVNCEKSIGWLLLFKQINII